VLCWLALSGGACLLERMGQEPVEIQPMSQPAEGDSNDVLRSETHAVTQQSDAIDDAERPPHTAPAIARLRLAVPTLRRHRQTRKLRHSSPPTRRLEVSSLRSRRRPQHSTIRSACAIWRGRRSACAASLAACPTSFRALARSSKWMPETPRLC
jgi:hypothetical protein